MLDGTCRLRRDGQDIFQMARIGTFSERVVCPAEMLVPIRAEMPWPQAALLGCCVPTGVGAVTHCAKVEAGSSVLVIGCGGVGLNVVQGARLAGAVTILACDLLDGKLAFAREFGATHTVNASRENVVERARELTGGRGVDYAFDAIGGEATTLQILDAIRPGGTAVIVGMAAMAVRAPVTPYLMALQEKTLKGTLYGSVRPNLDFPRLVDLYLDGRKDEAAAAVPPGLLEAATICGPEGYVRDRIAAYRGTGVTVLNVTPIGPDVPALVGRLKEWIAD